MKLWNAQQEDEDDDDDEVDEPPAVGWDHAEVMLEKPATHDKVSLEPGSQGQEVQGRERW